MLPAGVTPALSGLERLRCRRGDACAVGQGLFSIHHGDRISWILGLRKAEQFIPELSWLSGVLAEVIGESRKEIPSVKPHAGFTLPVGDGIRMRRFAPVRRGWSIAEFAICWSFAANVLRQTFLGQEKGIRIARPRSISETLSYLASIGLAKSRGQSTARRIL